jgi:hypothetical protein
MKRPAMVVGTVEGVNMVQSSAGKNGVSKNAAAFVVRIGLLLLLMSAALLLTGCTSMSSDDNSIFYKGWVNPKSQPLVQ